MIYTHSADDKLKACRGSRTDLEAGAEMPPRALLTTPRLPACPSALPGPLTIPQGPQPDTEVGTEDAADTLSPRLSPPLGSRERQVPKPHGATSASQDLGGGRAVGPGGGGGRGERTHRRQRRSSLQPYSCQLLRGAPISSFYLRASGCPRLPGNSHPSPLLP